MSQAGGGTGRAQIAVVGNRETVVAFQAAGLAVFPVEGAQAAEKVEELVADGFRVIFFTEELFSHLAPVLERYRKRAVPCLVALPVSEGSQESVARLKEVVKRAVGADVFGK
ncbi:V-type ATP synthase subunit F [candidate division WOR-3 bacterium]|nr:V-type ATP synthase subunit F [candidate division WOR-3 bacterium]